MAESYAKVLTEVLELLLVLGVVLVVLNMLQTLLIAIRRYITKLLNVMTHKAVILVVVAISFEIFKLNLRENRLLSQDFSLGTYVLLCTGIAILLVLHSATTAFLGSSATQYDDHPFSIKPTVRNVSTNTSGNIDLFQVEGISNCQKCKEYDEILKRQMDDRLCVVCQENPKCVVLLPCGHVCVCTECEHKLRGENEFQCPVCRQRVRETALVYV